MATANVPRAPATAPDVIINVPERLAELSSRGRPAGRPREPEKFTVFRVPLAVRKDNANVFEPSVISIGPFHRGKKELRAMEEHKVRFLCDFLSRRRTLSLDLLLEKMRPLETRARRSYCETVDLSSDEFLMMMVLDGCFLLEFFLRIDEGGWTETKNEAGWSGNYIQFDILMLENQIPFFIIETLFKILNSQPEDEEYGDDNTAGDDVEAPGGEDGGAEGGASDEEYGDDNKTIMPDEFLLMMVSSVIEHNKVRDPLPERPSEILHLLHLCHHYFVPLVIPSAAMLKAAGITAKKSHALQQSAAGITAKKSHALQQSEPLEVDYESALVIPSAAELQDAGIKIKKKEKVLHVLDVTFNKTTGVLEIPPLFLSDGIKPLFLNLLAFEQCVGDPCKHFTTFSLFLDCIVNTTEDVLILEGTKVVSNFLSGQEEAAAFFNSLGQGMTVDVEHYLAPVFRDINGYCRQRWNKYRAVLMKDYFGSPWALISVLAAFSLLALTFIQAVFVLYAYYARPTKVI